MRPSETCRSRTHIQGSCEFEAAGRPRPAASGNNTAKKPSTHTGLHQRPVHMPSTAEATSATRLDSRMNPLCAMQKQINTSFISNMQGKETRAVLVTLWPGSLLLLIHQQPARLQMPGTPQHTQTHPNRWWGLHLINASALSLGTPPYQSSADNLRNLFPKFLVRTWIIFGGVQCPPYASSLFCEPPAATCPRRGQRPVHHVGRYQSPHSTCVITKLIAQLVPVPSYSLGPWGEVCF